MGPRRARAPALPDLGARARGRRDLRPPAADVEQRRRDLVRAARPRRWTTSSATARATRSTSSTRARARSHTTFGDVPYKEGDYVVIPRGTTYKFEPSGPQRYLLFETPGLIEIPKRYRNEYGQLMEHAPFYHRDIHPPTELHDDPRARRVRRQGARPGRLPGLRRRLPPVRRGRLGRLPLPVDVLDPRLRADHRADPHAAALAPDVRRPELRHLLVLPAQARLRPDGGADPVPPLESPERGDDLLRRGQLLLAQGDRGRLDHAAPVRAPARAAAGARGEVARRHRDARARGDVRHVPPAQAVEARQGHGRRQVRVLVVRGARRSAHVRRGSRPARPRTSEPYSSSTGTARAPSGTSV